MLTPLASLAIAAILGSAAPGTPATEPSSPAAVSPAKPTPLTDAEKALVGRWRIDAAKTRVRLLAEAAKQTVLPEKFETTLALYTLYSNTLVLDLREDRTAWRVANWRRTSSRWVVEADKVIIPGTSGPGDPFSVVIDGSQLLLVSGDREDQALVLTCSGFGPAPTAEALVGSWHADRDELTQTLRKMHKDTWIYFGDSLDHIIRSIIEETPASISIHRDGTISIGNAEPQAFSIDRDWIVVGTKLPEQADDHLVLRWEGERIVLEGTHVTAPVVYKRADTP